MISRRGLIYTVEEVSDLLGIPRPTLYRYLREYSIPHLRKAGKISIPEDSFSRIREARDLHKEGLGTESVRRAMREGGPDTGELKERIERLSASLEGLKGNGSAADEALSSQAMRTILARQSLIMSAMFNLTEMVEELLTASGKPRKTVFEEVDGEIREVTLPDRRDRTRTRRAVPAGPNQTALPTPRALPSRSDGFGSLARRRRRTSLLLLALLLLCAVLALTLPRLVGGGSVDGTPLAGEARSEATPNGKPQERAAVDASPQNKAAPPQPSAADEGSGTAANASGSQETVQTEPGEIPDTSGRGVEEAARALSEAGYEVAAIQTVKSQEESGTVVRTEPAAGSKARQGAPVLLVISGGQNSTQAGT